MSAEPHTYEGLLLSLGMSLGGMQNEGHYKRLVDSLADGSLSKHRLLALFLILGKALMQADTKRGSQ